MSWIKKIANRLFGPDDDENLYENDRIEHEELKETPSETKSPPSFRFPIITDAEIYGWDEEGQEKPEKRTTDPVIDRKDNEDYETVPLYKNERWPGMPATGTIHRAGSSLKYGSSTIHEKVTPKSAPKEPLSTPPKPEFKRSGRPFSPTEIPSPVFGFKRPETMEIQQLRGDQKDYSPLQQAVEERESIFEDRTATDTDLNAMESVSEEISPTEIPSPIFGYQRPETMEIPQLEEDQIDRFPLQQEVEERESILEDQASTDTDFKATGSVTEEISAGSELLTGIDEVENDHTTENELLSASASNHDESHTVSHEEQADAAWSDRQYEGVPVQQNENEQELSHKLPEVSEQEPAEIQPEWQEEVHEPIENVGESDLSPDESAEIVEELVHEQPNSKERIVPFNVLMLKSDKEKLEKVMRYESASHIPEAPAVSKQAEARPEPAPAVQDEPPVAVTAVEPEEEEPPYYAFPSQDFLIPPEDQIEDTEWLESQSEKLEVALSHFSVQATVIEAVQGPSVTRFELTVAQGTKVSKVRNLSDDLKLALAAEDIRIQAPIPGRSSIGIEIPNRKTRPVRISEVIGSDVYQNSPSPLEAVLGLGLTGTPVTMDLRKMPHGMIAGATGSGKSVCINSILISLLYKASPTDLKMMLIDPKMVELAPFNGIPHLISPVITDVKAATAALKWAVAEMERRYELLAHAGVRDIERYNRQVIESRKFSLKMPYLLIVIDELADLMMMAPADVEVSISRIAQKARACGIHLIIATQRPSVDVITGTIKANVPTRIAFSVSSQIDSRTILDSPGAERLLGKGDMLYIGNGQSSAVRLQGTFVTDEEIERIIEHVQNEAEPNYLFGQEDLLAHAADEEEKDPLYEEACHFILEQGSASTSLLQRNFSIGYNRAAKLIDRMEKQGFISGQRGSKARDVYLTENDLDKIYKE